MIRLLPLPILLVLPGCAGLTEILSDPGVQDNLKQTAESAASGNLVGTLCGLGGTVAAVVAYKRFKKKGSPS